MQGKKFERDAWLISFNFIMWSQTLSLNMNFSLVEIIQSESKQSVNF